MEPNQVNPEAYANKQENKASNVSPIENIDMCTLQYYCPEPIIGARLAHSYVPFQYLCCLYPPEKGLQRGTIFPELDRAYGMDPEYLADR